MKIVLTIATALLLTACFSEDMKSGQSDTGRKATKISSLTQNPAQFLKNTG